MKLSIQIILFLFVLNACQTDNPNKRKFENHLPKEDLEILEELIVTFDKVINNNYGGEISKFLRKVADDEKSLSETDAETHCKLYLKFQNSTLEFKSENLKYQDVFFSNYYTEDGDIIYTKEPTILAVEQSGDTIWNGIEIFKENSEDAILEIVKQRGYWNPLSESSFLKALMLSGTDNEEIIAYMNSRELHGPPHVQQLATDLNFPHIETSNYFIKRIIVFEIFRRQIRKVSGC